MAIQIINIGNVANDGTGDDLREAMIKINQNFEELDLRDDEQTTASNLGVDGEGIFAQRLGYDLQFKKIIAGDNIALTATETGISVSANIGLNELTVNADTGNVTLDDVNSLDIVGGDGISTSITGSVLTITNDYVADLVEDLTPQLGGNLDAQGFNLLNVGTINAASVTGSFTGNLTGNVTGLVYGYDMRDWAQWNTGFDFGSVDTEYGSIIEWVVAQQDVDLGTFGAPTVGTIDLGSI
jgi:hypothetical protein